MSHYSRLFKVVVDVPDAGHDEELAFWQGAIGTELTHTERYPEYHRTVLPGGGFAFLVQRLDDDGPSRVHLDIHTDDLEAEVARLERLGAKRVQRAHSWWIMRDPAGLLFCVLPERPGVLTDDNAHRWD
jgi:hypothetical protein